LATDFLLALLPVPLIWRLQLNLQAKISLICVLTLGLFAGVAGIVKSQKQKAALYHLDQYIQDTFTMWWFIEFNVGIIAASLPALKPLFRRILETARNSTLAKSSAARNPSGLGYHRQDERSDKGIMLDEYDLKSNNSVTISSVSDDKGENKVWNTGHMKNRDTRLEAIGEGEDTPRAMFVAGDVHAR
jgi:hypothetical protein